MDNRHLCRGKRTGSRDWVYGVPIYDGSGICYMITEMMSQITCCEECGMPDTTFYVVDPDTVSQCTGLTAAKSYRGTEPEDLLVFEGDVCQDDQGGPFVIEFINTPQFYGLAMKYLTDGELLHLEEFSPITDRIIGNRWDNPELLEVDGE